MKFLKIMVLAALLSFSPCVLAKGIYVGVGATNNSFNLANKNVFDPGVVNNPAFYNVNYNITANTIAPSFFLGYKYDFVTWFIAGEFGLDFNNFQRSFNDSLTLYNRFIFHTAYTLKAKFGYNFSPRFKLYTLLGYMREDIDRDILFNPNGGYAPLDLVAVYQTQDIHGGLVGLGFEEVITAHWHIAAEYQHTFLTNTDYTFQNAFFSFLGNVGSNQMHLSHDAIMLKMLYYI